MAFLSRVVALKRKSVLRARAERWDSPGGTGPIAVEGVRKINGTQSRSRIFLVMLGFLALYLVVGGRMVQYGMAKEETVASIPPPNRLLAARPDILDRNGRVLATDIRTVSLFAEPRKIVDPDDAVEKLLTVLPDLDRREVYRRLTSDTAFQWLQRQLTPKQQSEILALGIPGIGFRPETRRFYPSGPTASHVVGFVNIDNKGIAGMEKYIDSQGLSALAAAGMTVNEPLKPVHLSVDLKVQHIVRDVLVNAMERYQSKGAGAVVLNIKTGEVIALASVPDFDPNNPIDALKPDRLNRMTAGVYEMGSTFKTFTSAMALDTGTSTMDTVYDVSKPFRIDGFTIHDFDREPDRLTVPEVFIYSSNIGSAKEALRVGIEGHEAFLRKLGLLSRAQTELPEVAAPIVPQDWKRITSVTVAFGHGISVTPLQEAVAAAAVLNGGYFMNPTFLPRTEAEAMATAKRVIKPKTSAQMRYLYRLNVLQGSGSKADIQGYRVGGKTGTADKVVDGRYSKTKNFTDFMAAFPIDDPQYIVLTCVDEPKPTKTKYGYTAGMNAAPMAGEIIRRAAPALGVEPKFGVNSAASLVSF
ncbi:MAG TPA: penicillin-binding protein 2 [Pararhizobium sp.]|nr:penicillin-binding protein 2 [Pararhizobium sp.]